MYTNKQMMEIKGVDEEAVQDQVCEYCIANSYFSRLSMGPGFTCEGRFCGTAWDEWLEEEWECEDDE